MSRSQSCLAFSAAMSFGSMRLLSNAGVMRVNGSALVSNAFSGLGRATLIFSELMDRIRAHANPSQGI